MTYKIIIHTDYSNELVTCIMNKTKHYYYESVTLRDVYETDNGMAIIFSASSPSEMINGVMNSTSAKFEIIPLGFVDGWRVKFGTYKPDDKKKETKVNINK